MHIHIKKIICIALVSIIALALFSACGAEDTYPKYTDITPDATGNVTLSTDRIGSEARFFNYDAEGVTVQLVALRDKQNKVHVAFNTCQNCSPSPKAYYTQKGDILECSNCGFTFEPEEVGIVHGGCNPWPVDGVSITAKEIVIPQASIDAMKAPFSTWEGPVS